MPTVNRILVANRGEIACRIFQTCRHLGIETVAVYSDADESARHVREADQAIHIGDSRAQASYLLGDSILSAAKKSNADAIHPGYGFLSEDHEFAEQVADAGITWIGPSPSAMFAMADKVRARTTVKRAGVPVVPGSETVLDDPIDAVRTAERIGYPIMVKASAGGGGFGMKIVESPDMLEAATLSAAENAKRYFGSGDVYLEKFIRRARHIEVQLLGFPSGEVLVVGDRDCTIQRRHQKIFEEAPAPGLTNAERQQLHEWARAVAESVDYQGAGTVEMVMDLEQRSFYFLEMNTRLQVEHPVTELVSGMDLVEAQIKIASDDSLVESGVPRADGHALEFRIYAEDPLTFRPGPGTLNVWQEAEGPGIRVDSGYQEGDKVTPYYDALLAKLCVHGEDRSDAVSRMADAVQNFKIDGIKNNLPLAVQILKAPTFLLNHHDTSLLTSNEE